MNEESKRAISALSREQLEAQCLALANALFGVLDTSVANAATMVAGLAVVQAVAKEPYVFLQRLRELDADAKKLLLEARQARAEILLAVMEYTGASSEIGKVTT